MHSVTAVMLSYLPYLRFCEGDPAGIMIGRGMNREVTRKKTRYSLTSPGGIKLLENQMPGGLLPAYLNTVQFGKGFSGIIKKPSARGGVITLKLFTKYTLFLLRRWIPEISYLY